MTPPAANLSLLWKCVAALVAAGFGATVTASTDVETIPAALIVAGFAAVPIGSYAIAICGPFLWLGPRRRWIAFSVGGLISWLPWPTLWLAEYAEPAEIPLDQVAVFGATFAFGATLGAAAALWGFEHQTR
ncbi:hypothetical protein [Alienimonas chondri]|uniref:SPW repeat-containing protein n=1 Tax=Alienimonas chondri TaxID=2681879 RepID=A0ABX1VAC7_9PLAN|nr:hypothetical protein [Alienimonas chondri]NNJ25018.1 hypothetical protein [Alienimonas chondri]